MKRLINFICIFVLSFIFTSSVQAATYHPKSISFTAPSTAYNGGASEPAQIFLKTKETGIPANTFIYDIGVAKEIHSGSVVEYQILGSDRVTYEALEKDAFKYSVKIPNLLEKSEDTFVVFIKSYRENDPDSESFVVSKSFNINPTNKKTVTLDRGFIVTSTGEAFGLSVGPTLYAKAQKSTHATSAEIALQMTSNSKVELKGTMTFKKLRSNDFSETKDVSLTVFDGQDIYPLELPTFNYEPGVYMGELNLGAEGVQTPQKISFQYIIDGPMVSAGQMYFVSATSTGVLFNMPVFGRPVDLYTNGNGTSTDDVKEVYKTTLVFMDKEGMILREYTTELDYKKGVRQILVPDLNWKKVKSVAIKVVDENDKTIFTTTQNLSLPVPERDITHLIYALSILLLGASWFMVSRKKGVIVWTTIFFALFVSAYAFAAWAPTDASGNILNVNNDPSKYKTYFTFNEDFTTEPISCVEDTDVFLKMVFLECQNRVRESANFGVSRVSMQDARNRYASLSYNIASSTCNGGDKIIRWKGREIVIPCGSSGHDNFLFTTDFIKIATLRGPIPANSKLYISVDGTKGLNAEYAMPLAQSSCDRCSNVAGEQIAKAFSAYGRDYFHSTADNKLYFAATSALGASVCAVDMCADTEAQEESMPEGKVWNTNGTSGYEKYSCIEQTTQTCTCSGRTQVCTENGNQTQTPNASQCALQASCTFAKSGNQATFTFTPLRALGNITYSGENPVTRTIPTNGSVTETMSITDSFDGMTASASCTASFNDQDTTNNNNNGNPDGGDCDPAVTTCTDNNGTGGNPSLPPVISKFTATKFVEQGQSCVFAWEVQNAASCTLGGQSVNPNASKSFPTTDGKNITKTLSCTNGGDTPQVVNRTATCAVNPTVKQN